MDNFNGIHADDQQRHVNKLDAQFGWSFKAHPAAPSSQSFYNERKAPRLQPWEYVTVQTHG